jgi:hypothetical protein
VCYACERQVTTWLALLFNPRHRLVAESGLTCRRLLHRRLLSLSAKETSPRAPRLRPCRPNAPRPARRALPSRPLPPPTPRCVCGKSAAGPRVALGPS